MVRFFFIVFFTLLCEILLSQVQRETRAVWLTTNFALDWPPKTLNVNKQKEELRKIFANLKEKNFNTVYFQVRSNGTVLYKSSSEPFSPYITGIIDNNPPYDPLQLAINLGKEFNLEVHAWLNMIRCFSGSDLNLLNSSRHIKNRKPHWIIKYNENNNSSYWLNPGLPEVQDYLVKMLTEITSKYDVDGIHLDFFRYPGKSFPDETAFKKYGNNQDKEEWRRNNLTEILRKFEKVKNPLNKFLKVGVTPVGIRKSLPYASGWEGFTNVYQDTETWLAEGIVDYLTPQIYWNFTENPKFDILANDWVKKSYNKNIVLGLAAYKTDVQLELKKMIDYSRAIGASGVAFFRYESILQNQEIFFDNIAFPSNMNWKEPINNYPSFSIECNFENLSDDEVQVNWQNFPNQSNEYLRNYVLYEIKDSKNVLKIISLDKDKLKIKFNHPIKLAYNYVIGSIDRLWNEINNSSSITVQVPFLLNFKLSSKYSKKPLVFNIDSNFFILNVFSEINQNSKIEILSKENIYKEIFYHLEFGFNFIKIEENLQLLKSIKIVYTAENRSEEINFY